MRLYGRFGSQRFPCTAFIVGPHRLNCRQHHSTFCNVRALCESYRRYFNLSAPTPPPLRPASTSALAHKVPLLCLFFWIALILSSKHHSTFWNVRGFVIGFADTSICRLATFRHLLL